MSKRQSLYEELLSLAEANYKARKMQKYPYKAPEELPGLGDTAKAILHALAHVLENEGDGA